MENLGRGVAIATQRRPPIPGGEKRRPETSAKSKPSEIYDPVHSNLSLIPIRKSHNNYKGPKHHKEKNLPQSPIKNDESSPPCSFVHALRVLRGDKLPFTHHHAADGQSLRRLPIAPASERVSVFGKASLYGGAGNKALTDGHCKSDSINFCG